MNLVKRNYIFDFDSTLTKVEALDILAEITLANNPKKDAIIQEIIDTTNLGIDGEISFTASLEKRIKLLKANKTDLSVLIDALEKQVSKSIESNKAFFEEFANDIYVISCGFKEFIDPIVAAYNIPSERVFANTFEFAADGEIVGFDAKNPLSQHNGKIQCLKDMGLEGEIQVIGDGYSE
jgi:D-3-phosphoglycerate dehydrogenase